MALVVKRWVFIVLLAILVFWKSRFLFNLSDNSKAAPPQPKRAHHTSLVVLVWIWPFGDVVNLSSDVCSTMFHIEGCHLTTDRSLFSQADVVAFHHRDIMSRRAKLPPAKAHLGQKWLWVSLESPTHNWDGRICSTPGWNWVMSYQRDADIFIPYGELVPRAQTAVDIPEKSRLVSWVVSSSRSSQARVKMFASLSRHIKIDVFGKAARKPLCQACLLPTISKYKFYLAFENSVHHDYITEKLWRNALLAGSVPVVLGPSRANYQEFIPADAFIHVEDFRSAEELASFLTNMNESHYRSFFAWKQRYAVRLFLDWRERFCTICQRYPSLPQEKVYLDLRKWC